MGRVHRSDAPRLPATDRENCARVFRGFPFRENAVAVSLLTRCVLLFFIERLCKHRAKFLPLSHVSRAGLTAETLLVLPGLRCSLLARWGVGGGGRARPRREGRACSGRWTVDRRWSVDGGGGACAVRGGRGTRTRLAFYISFSTRFSPRLLSDFTCLYTCGSLRVHTYPLRLYFFTVRFTLNQLSKHSRPSGLWALWPDETPEQSC